ncbi:MAG TPA: MlaD family protein [Bacteroidia bacterium]|nr:MlaD family protein [Bacteroidia bacterium]
MQKKTGNKIRLGVFVTITVLLFIVGIYFIGEKQQLFNRTFRVSTIFKDINGLQVGNNVRYTGVDIGIVDGIVQASDSTVRVTMEIDESTRKFIKKNVKATISSDGLMGNKIISIIPGTPGKPEISNNDVIESVQPVSMDNILTSVKVTTDNLANMSGDLAAIMKNIHEGKGTIGKLFMDSAMAQNVSQAMVNIKQGAGGFKQNMNAASHSFLLRGYLNKKKKDEAKKNEKNTK